MSPSRRTTAASDAAANPPADQAGPAKRAGRKTTARATGVEPPPPPAGSQPAAKAAGRNAAVRAAADSSVSSGATAAPDLATTRRARRILRLLGARYPAARLELDFDSPLQLLVAAVLAAQTLDERVNAVRPVLFGRFPTAADLAGADAAAMEQILVPVGYFRQKTKSVIKLAAALVEQHDGEVPQTFDELVALPWVGRKTANMVLGNAFGIPAVSVDTHVSRVAHRLDWAPEKDVEATEAAIEALFDKKDWVAVNLLLILHGRRTCHSRKPACGACPLAGECPSVGLDGKGEMDPEKARALLK